MNGLALIIIVCLPVFMLALGLGVSAKFGEKAASFVIGLSFLSLFVFEDQIIHFLLSHF